MTDEQRWITIDGRRWRATDPSIPAALRQELVDELMSARRAVAAASRRDDPDALIRARRRVHATKVALGERGAPWWLDLDDRALRPRIEATIAALAGRRAPDRTICPSDVARVVGGATWRRQMDLVRLIAADMADARQIEIVQRGQRIEGRSWRGPVRLRGLEPTCSG